jgi:phosphatidylserine/phosphatidylglycerophosphate/cardiolipin synthase-like enzyme
MIYELWARKEQEEEAEREAAYERALEKAFERLKQLKQRLKPLTGDFVTPADLRTKVVDAIKAATESIFVLVYTFTERQIVDALLAAHDRGVRVWVIVDLSQWKKTPRMQHAMTRLTQGSIPVFNSHLFLTLH